MSITVKQLVEEVKLSSTDIESVQWGDPIDCKKEGVYIVSLSKSKDSNEVMEELPISMSILKDWINKLGYFELDKKVTKDAEAIKDRLSEFWIPDESILYIGQTGREIGKRVRDYYRTVIGASKPHAGGHWLKLLENLKELRVFYIPCSKPKNIEKEMLQAFGRLVSEDTKNRLSGKDSILPFANLEDGDGKRKKHGLGHMKLK